MNDEWDWSINDDELMMINNEWMMIDEWMNISIYK